MAKAYAWSLQQLMLDFCSNKIYTTQYGKFLPESWHCKNYAKKEYCLSATKAIVIY
jgi:hypothetical protein